MNFKTQLESRLIVFFCALLLTLASVNFAFAQSGTSSVTGTVKDAQGNVVPNATIKLINDEKGFSRTLVTTDAGVYSFASIPPDTYRLEVEASGFKKYVQTNIGALIDKTTEVSLNLEAGNISETVNVTADSIDSIINTQDATIGNNFQPQQIQQLPTQLRNIPSLLSLQPGVTREGYVNGGRSDQANITLDGIDVNEQQNGEAFNSVLRITAESIDEFRVTTSNPNANQGRSSGAQISLSTKGGTNNFRGAAFFFRRPNLGSANDFFNNLAGLERQDIRRNTFGGAIGGPIIKDKFFFFYSYEGQREKLSSPITQTVPLASLGRGEVRLKDLANGNVITLNQNQLNTIFTAIDLNPVALNYLAAVAQRYPANVLGESAFGDGLNTAGFRFNAPTSEDLNTHIARLDYNLNSNQTLFVRANKQNDINVEASFFPDTFAPQTWTHSTGVAAGHNWIIGSNKINNFRYGLTRQAFTAGGDANENFITFRFVFEPLDFTYTNTRVTPVHNFTDDFTWTLGNHTLQFGGNIRVIRNRREDLQSSFDTAVINPSYYNQSGRSLINPIRAAGFNVSNTNLLNQAAVAAVIGRYSQYSANFNFDIDGNVLPSGTPISRTFATEEYDSYIQDSWKINQNFTLNLGLRYALSRPVYETGGYQIRPNIPLGEYFERRRAGSAQGVPYNELLDFELAGPKNDKPGFYSLDKNNFQPRISAAWSPNFKSGFLGNLLGKNNESVFRGGFAMTNDYFGQQLAVTFNRLSSLGFKFESTIGPNTFNVTTNPGPLFTGNGQQIRNFGLLSPPTNRFQTPADEDTRIENSLDSSLVSPVNYNWSFSYGRKLPAGLYVEAQYVGRKARNLLVERDVLAFNNLVDPRSGTDWYTAAGRIYDYYYAGTPTSAVAPIPYFENLFPNLASPGVTATQAVYNLNASDAFGDWTYLQLLLDDAGATPNLFVQPQYAAFSAYSTVGKSDYHGGSVSIRQRLGSELSFDLNYTFSKSLDDSSGLQRSGGYGQAFVLNSLRQQDNYSYSDFDTRHVVNANGIWQLPFGRDRRFFSNMNKYVDVFVGGWQLAGIYRWNSGLPIGTPTDLSGWATNWNIRSGYVRTRPIQTSTNRTTRNIFSDNNELLGAIRPPKPGETGDRNVFRESGYSELDMSLSKSFRMPWSENHNLQIRWEVFNAFNYQYLTGISTFSATPDIPLSNSTFTAGSGELTEIRGTPRRMQFGLRYSF